MEAIDCSVTVERGSDNSGCDSTVYQVLALL